MRGTAMRAVARSRLMVRTISLRIGGIFEDDCRAEQRRDEQGHELAEDVAERNQRDEAQRMKPLLVFAIGIDAAFERLEIRQEIAVGQNDAARLAGRAGREENLREVISRDGLVGERCVRSI